MGDYGVSVSKPGKDVTSVEPRDFVVNSKYTAIKIVQDSLGTITVGTAGAYGTITHNLGFVPMIMLYTELTPNSDQWYFSYPLAPEEDTTLNEGTVGTATAIFHLVNNTASSKDIRYHYFIMGDSA